MVPASDAPGGSSLPDFTSKKEEQQTPPPAPVAEPESADDEEEASAPAVDRVVASVDGDPSRCVRCRISRPNMAGRSTPTTSLLLTAAKTAVKALIGEKLLEQEVKKYEDKVDEAQVDKYITQLRMDKHMSDAIPRQLKASGMSYDDLRKRARLDLEKAMMLQQEVREKIEIPDAEIQAAYDAHKADFTVAKERLKIAQILIACRPMRLRSKSRRAKESREDSRARRQGRRFQRSRADVIQTTTGNPTAANSDGSSRQTLWTRSSRA